VATKSDVERAASFTREVLSDQIKDDTHFALEDADVESAAVLLPTTVVIVISLCATSECYGQRTGPVAVAEVAPDFTLEDQSGHKVTLSDARGKSPVVLVFYRGYW